MKKGFTLIELLIVISIIGVLAAISIFGLQGARESARDAKRKSDLESIRSALELYRADCDIYPAPPLGTSITGTCTGGTNTYMNDVPQDPLGGAYAYTQTSPTDYTLCTILEDPPSTPNDVSGCGTCSGGAGSCGYQVLNP